MNALESKWTKKICSELELCGAIVVPMVAGSMSNGWPDRIIWHPSWQGFVEFKAEKTVDTKQQQHNRQALNRRAPGTAVVARYPGYVHCVTQHYETTGVFNNARELLGQLAAIQAEAVRRRDATH